MEQTPKNKEELLREREHILALLDAKDAGRKEMIAAHITPDAVDPDEEDLRASLDEITKQLAALGEDVSEEQGRLEGI